MFVTQTEQETSRNNYVLTRKENCTNSWKTNHNLQNYFSILSHWLHYVVVS